MVSNWRGDQLYATDPDNWDFRIRQFSPPQSHDEGVGCTAQKISFFLARKKCTEVGCKEAWQKEASAAPTGGTIIWIQKGKPTQSPAPLWIPRWYQQSTREEKKPMVRRTIWQRLQRSLKKPWLTLLLPQSFGNKPTQSLGTFVDSEDDMLRTRSWEL